MPNLEFNTRIYKKEAIQQAISAYSRFAKFKIKYNKGYLRVRIEKIDPKVKDMFVDEFGNYVLAMTKKCL